MRRLARALRWPVAFLLALALTFSVASAWGQEKPSEGPKVKALPVAAEFLLEQALLEQQAENLRLRVCSDAGINWRRCEVRWRERVVVDTSTLPKGTPKED
jgi:hypothetical protein